MNSEKEILKLKDKYTRFANVNLEFKYLHLSYLWDFIHNNYLFKSIIEPLNIKGELNNSLLSAIQIVDNNQGQPLPRKEENRLILTYYILKKVLSPNHNVDIMYQIGRNYSSDKTLGRQYYFNLFNHLFIEPFIQYLEYELEQNKVILTILKDYKYKSEWFKREYLYEIAQKDTSKSEHNLTLNFYEFLFDKGVELFIEPWSKSGVIDLIALQKQSSEKIIIEGKIFDGKNRGKSYIVNAIGQILPHIKENNEQFGYIVIYKNCFNNLELQFNNEKGTFPYLKIDNKIIFFIIIDIFKYEKTSSKRGLPKTTIISEKDVITD